MQLSDYNEKIELNAKNVLSLISEEDIYKQYLPPEFRFDTAFSSPFRVDKIPSFIIGGRNKLFRYKDFATGETGNCFNFVMNLYNINFNDALTKIVNDFNIEDRFILSSNCLVFTHKAQYNNPSKNYSLNIGETELLIKSRPFQEHDLIYWESHGISIDTLRIGNVVAISHYFINKIMYIAERYSYAFIEKKDNKITYKIYQPYSKYKKWINNNNYSVWELWNILPNSGDNLIITSSRKDALSIIENLKIPSTSFQAESVMPKEVVMNEIFSRFNNVYLLYDNDYSKEENWGQKLALKLIVKYPQLKNIVIPENYLSKDYSDLTKHHGRKTASIILIKELKENGFKI